MTPSRSWILAILVLPPAVLPAQQTDRAHARPLNPERFAELQKQLTPDVEAPWRTIPWRVDLLAAQREAARANKPLFIWAMDGHPLGCT